MMSSKEHTSARSLWAKQNKISLILIQRGFTISPIPPIIPRPPPPCAAPPKIGRKLTAAQKARATHVCLDCGWVYALPTAFEEQPKEYRCAHTVVYGYHKCVFGMVYLFFRVQIVRGVK